MSCVGAGDAVAEVAFDPGQRREPCGNLSGCAVTNPGCDRSGYDLSVRSRIRRRDTHAPRDRPLRPARPTPADGGAGRRPDRRVRHHRGHRPREIVPGPDGAPDVRLRIYVPGAVAALPPGIEQADCPGTGATPGRRHHFADLTATPDGALLQSAKGEGSVLRLTPSPVPPPAARPHCAPFRAGAGARRSVTIGRRDRGGDRDDRAGPDNRKDDDGVARNSTWRAHISGSRAARST